MSETSVYGDLDSLKELNISSFLKSQPWPFSDDEFHEISQLITKSYISLAQKSENKFLFQFLLIEMGFVEFLINHLNYRITKKITLKGKGDFISRPHSYIAPNWQELKYFYDLERIKSVKGKFFIRRLLKNILFNRNASFKNIVTFFFRKSSRIVSLGSNELLKRIYIKKNKLLCDYQDWQYLFKRKKFINSNHELYVSQKEICNFVGIFFNEVKKYISKFDLNIDFDVLSEVWIRRLNDINTLFFIAEDISKQYAKILVSETANPFHKIISLAFDNDFKRAINFSHGNDSALLLQVWAYQMVFGHCSNFVVENETIKSRFVQSSSTRLLEKRTETNYIVSDENPFVELRDSNKFFTPNSKKIMLMGYPMCLSRNIDTRHLFFHNKLIIESSVAAILVKANKNLIYKAHPERVTEIKHLMELYTRNIEIKPFESVWKDVGVLIFTYTATTTFSYAINLPIPIVLLVQDGNEWQGESRVLLEKRVEFLDVETKNLETNLDTDRLLNAINNAKQKVSKINAEIAVG